MFRKKEKPDQEGQKQEKRLRVKKIGTHKKSVLFLWMLLIGSVTFGVYKNFTAVDVRHETVREVVEKELINTNDLEEFVKDFAEVYYSWENTKSGIEQRTLAISQYMTEELQNINLSTVEIDVSTSSKVDEVQIWDVEGKAEDTYEVTFSVSQTVTELVGEGKKKEETEVTVKRAYKTLVHKDGQGDMVIVKNPTMCNMPEKSAYEPGRQEEDGTVDADTRKEVTEFLESFFVMYPTANEKDLAYYVRNNALEPANGDYIFSELLNPIYVMEGDKVRAYVYAGYADQWTKTEAIFEYHLLLEKQEENWVIVGAD